MISGLIAGPAVSLNGSPTVSPMTVASWAREPLPPWLPSSTSFLALSQAPPELARKTAIRVPAPIAPARKPASAVDAEAEADRDRGEDGQQAGRDQLAQRVLGDDVDDLAVLRTAGALHDPGDLAELATHLEDHRAGGAADRVDRQAGEQEHHGRAEQHADEDCRVEHDEVEQVGLVGVHGLASLERLERPTVAYDPNSAVAASTAVAIAMPLVIALVVLPTASSSVRICAPSGLTSPDISAMPWALSETGPKVSIATMTPTVVSRPQPASATANSETVSEAPPSRNAPNTAAPMTSVV